jgi:hypothetical protein
MFTMMMDAKAEIEKTKTAMQEEYAKYNAKCAEYHKSHAEDDWDDEAPSAFHWRLAGERHELAIKAYVQLEETMQEMLASTKAELKSAREAMYEAYDEEMAAFNMGEAAEIAAKKKYRECLAATKLATQKYSQVCETRLKLHNNGKWISVAEAYQMLKDAGTELEGMANASLTEVRAGEAKYEKVHKLYTAAYGHHEAQELLGGLPEMEPKMDEVNADMSTGGFRASAKEIAEEPKEIQEIDLLAECAAANEALEHAHGVYNLAVEKSAAAATTWGLCKLEFEKVEHLKKGRDFWKALYALTDSEKNCQAATAWETKTWDNVGLKESAYEHAADALEITRRLSKVKTQFKNALVHLEEMRDKKAVDVFEFEAIRHDMNPLYDELFDAARQSEIDADEAERAVIEAEMVYNIVAGEYSAFFERKRVAAAKA